MSEERRTRTAEAFFGRRHGKTIRPMQAVALADVLPRLKVDLSAAPPDDLHALFPVPVERIVLEIGFGGGEHLHHAAGAAPATGFIGVEPFVNGMASLLRMLEREARPNIRLYDDDATALLDWLPDGSLDRIDLFYPDPWPKKRHWKRRFVNLANLDRFARVLKPGGLFRFASDIDHYVNWTLLEVARQGGFSWRAETPDDWRVPYEGWPGTRYEAKALREGRTPAYLTFVRA
ncbi:tRNA (guanosine(46)-N(7))-methyltransferase TrmB [Mesorhizobium sp. J428]|uniref:tRNA (guanine(46)-N(7))-methyltransferase TrmB n=1 Tax=Mesorhizobium sp. J428 TaxID=2898440 RepID=UPI002150F4B7|nr:tRNA (guanosine(46)-N(7))-methyltransferase TrmB [Mesorhizobium sp. J428]MCR5857848.1 tRNA (guanosine(46)-N(7))-methyltransferase TrmB [Mesorhizobium sp. J428]